MDLAEHPGEPAAGGGLCARNHQVGAVVHRRRPGQRLGRKLRCHPPGQVGRPELGPPGIGRRVQNHRPPLPQRLHRGLDELLRAGQRLVDEQPDVGERHDVGAEGSGSLPVGVPEVPCVQRTAARG